MHRRFPGLSILLNRGFAILPEIGHLAVGLVAESLYQGWDASTGQYIEVAETDRRWLINVLRDANERYHLPITVIDYVSPDNPELARITAQRIKVLGFSPWVSIPTLNTIGVENLK